MRPPPLSAPHAACQHPGATGWRRVWLWAAALPPGGCAAALHEAPEASSDLMQAVPPFALASISSAAVAVAMAWGLVLTFHFAWRSSASAAS